MLRRADIAVRSTPAAGTTTTGQLRAPQAVTTSKTRTSISLDSACPKFPSYDSFRANVWHIRPFHKFGDERCIAKRCPCRRRPRSSTTCAARRKERDKACAFARCECCCRRNAYPSRVLCLGRVGIETCPEQRSPEGRRGHR